MRGVVNGLIISFALYLAVGLVILAVRGPVRLGEFGFFKETAR